MGWTVHHKDHSCWHQWDLGYSESSVCSAQRMRSDPGWDFSIQEKFFVLSAPGRHLGLGLCYEQLNTHARGASGCSKTAAHSVLTGAGAPGRALTPMITKVQYMLQLKPEFRAAAHSSVDILVKPHNNDAGDI